VALVAFAIGGLFLILAHFIGVLNYQVCWDAPGVTPNFDWTASRLVSCTKPYDLMKQVGFGAALNWSVGLTFLFPLFAYCACETANTGRAAISEMYDHKMILTKKWARPARADIQKLVNKRVKTIVAVVTMTTALAAIFVPFEYASVVGEFYPEPQHVGEFSLKDVEREADWSIAGPICRFTENTTGPCERPTEMYDFNGMFAGGAYAYLVFFGVIAAVGFMLSFGIYVRFFFSTDLTVAGYVIIPDVTSEDERRGFEALEPFFLHAVAGCFVLFAMGYLVTLQNVYLRTDYANVLSLIVPYLVDVKSLSPDAVISAIKDALTKQLIVLNGNSVAVSVLGFLFILVMISAAASALGRTARLGQIRVLDTLDSPGEAKQRLLAQLGVSEDAARAALETVRRWPMKWPTLNVMIAWLILAILSLVFVTIGFLIMSIGLAFVVKEAVLKRN
jgi:hypothetical protein